MSFLILVGFIAFSVMLGKGSGNQAFDSPAVNKPRKVPLENADWSPFQILSQVNQTFSSELIESFPVYHYWDLLKGSYRTGAILSSLSSSSDSSSLSSPIALSAASSWLNFSSKVDKHINHVGKHYSISQDILDTSQLFMHLLASIQSLSSRLDSLTSQLMKYERRTLSTTSSSSSDGKSQRENDENNQFYFHFSVDLNDTILDSFNLPLQTKSLIQEYGWSVHNLTSSKVLSLKKEILSLRLSLLSLSSSYEALQHSNNLQLLSEKYSLKRSHYDELSSQVLSQLHTYNTTVNELLDSHEIEIMQFLNAAYNKEKMLIQQNLESEFQAALQSYELEMKQLLSLIAYKAEEEKKFLEIQSKKENSLFLLQSKVQSEKNEIMISIIFNELIEKIFNELFSSSSASTSSSTSDSTTFPTDAMPARESNSSSSFQSELFFYLQQGQYYLYEYILFPKLNFLRFTYSLVGFFLLTITFIEIIKSLQLIILKYYFSKYSLYSQESFLQSWFMFSLYRVFILRWSRMISFFWKSLTKVGKMIKRRTKGITADDDDEENVDKKKEKERKELVTLFQKNFSLILSHSLEKKLLHLHSIYSTILSHNQLSASRASSPSGSSVSSSSRLLSLPNSIFLGDPGCGKSLSVKALLSSLQSHYSSFLSTIMISGSDLLSLGNYSGHYLKELLDSYSYYQMPLLLIIDECDSILLQRSSLVGNSNDVEVVANGLGKRREEPQTIAERLLQKEEEKKKQLKHKQQTGNGNGSGNENDKSEFNAEREEKKQQRVNLEELEVEIEEELIERNQQKIIHNTLFSLLEGFRNSSPFISVILITRLSVQEIDSAILDR
jgi:hypothetical protein